MPHFIYVMDPMCSWCWAFNPTIKALRNHYPQFGWHVLLGGLAPDSHETMTTEMQEKLQSIWQHIERKTGTHFNYDFWSKNTPRRSTYPACRAVISAESLMPGSCLKMINLIQKAYYQDAMNPSDDEVLIDLASDAGINPDIFKNYLNNQETQTILDAQIQQAHQLGAQGFPSLFIQTGTNTLALSYGYTDTETMLQRVRSVLEKNDNIGEVE